MVLGRCQALQMLGVDARTIAAAVVDLVPIGDRPVRPFPGGTVRVGVVAQPRIPERPNPRPNHALTHDRRF